MPDIAFIQAGTLRHQITINAQSTTTDSYGQPIQAWASILVTRASIRAVTNKELYSLGGFVSAVTHKIVIRFPAITIKAGMQVGYLGRIFNIQSVSDPDENKRELDLYVQELSS